MDSSDCNTPCTYIPTDISELGDNLAVPGSSCSLPSTSKNGSSFFPYFFQESSETSSDENKESPFITNAKDQTYRKFPENRKLPPKTDITFDVHCLQYVSEKFKDPPADKAFVLVEPLPNLLSVSKKITVDVHGHPLKIPGGSGDAEIMDVECFAVSATYEVRNYKIGILGYVNDNLGKQIACILARKGHAVYVCEETIKEREEEWLSLEDCGANFLKTIKELITICDVTFCFLPLNTGAKEVFYASISPYAKGKDFVFFSYLDHETCADFAEDIHRQDGRYLEAPVCTTGVYEENKALSRHQDCILVAGDKDFFEEFKIYFLNIIERVFFLGEEAGLAAKMNMLLGTTVGIMMTAISEACLLSSKQNLKPVACLMSDMRKMFRCAFNSHPINTTALDAFIDDVTLRGRTALPKNKELMMSYAAGLACKKGTSFSVTSIALQQAKMASAVEQMNVTTKKTRQKRKMTMTK